MTADLTFSCVRGFNYHPAYSANLQQTWTQFDAVAWQRETPWALRFGANTLRLWLDWSAYLALGPALLHKVDTALAILEGHRLKAVLVLFNRWVDRRFPVGGISDNDLRVAGPGFEKFHAYVDAIGGRFGGDPRILAWDLCNTPLSKSWNALDILPVEADWLADMAARLRRHTATPVTIGAMTYDYVEQTAGLCDVLGFQPYPGRPGEMERLCADHVAMAKRLGKPLLCVETCCGSFDDQERGALARDNIETLERHRIGWLAWMLCAGAFVTGSRERPDSNSLRPDEGYMPFVLADGMTRPGHEWLEERSRHMTNRGEATP